ncbi:aminoglycoside phosphotransferase family protein [Spiribacter vilamensis]|uniref:aminoglycoside phosphotransferase family protein n=1 Tax=Spiribacter vilamensis TaxID=531306 RepID=UPI00102C1B38|nr:phosphotransferase [Spiribacter vilamensis]TVO61241.1 phosphotransferase [Spiribacter vilamensis]
MAIERFDPRGERMIEWLRAQGVAPMAIHSMGGDASNRRYFRLDTPRGTRVVMDAPDQFAVCEAFRHVRRVMADAELHVPIIHAADSAAGFMLLEDLGDRDYLGALRDEPRESLLTDAIDALVRLQRRAPPDWLPRFDASRIAGELALFPDWYVRRHLGIEPDARWWSRWHAGTAVLVEEMARQSRVVVHRDYMVRNLMVATPNPGIIDFQDALVGPVVYDLASLLRDAFFSLDPAEESVWIDYYRDQARAAEIMLPDNLSRAIDRTAAQRHLKVLGIFARLCHRDHKPGYIADAARFLGYLQRELGDDPRCRDLARLIADLPSPDGGAPA